MTKPVKKPKSGWHKHGAGSAFFGRNVLPPKPKLTTESWWIGLSRRAFQKAVKDRFPES